jgi:hypothetical protein
MPYHSGSSPDPDWWLRTRESVEAAQSISRVVRVCSEVDPSFSQAVTANLTIVDGPQMMAAVLAGSGRMRSRSIGTTPTSLCPPSHAVGSERRVDVFVADGPGGRQGPYVCFTQVRRIPGVRL